MSMEGAGVEVTVGALDRVLMTVAKRVNVVDEPPLVIVTMLASVVVAALAGDVVAALAGDVVTALTGDFVAALVAGEIALAQ